MSDFVRLRYWLHRLEPVRGIRYEIHHERPRTAEERRAHLAKIRQGRRRTQAAKRWANG